MRTRWAKTGLNGLYGLSDSPFCRVCSSALHDRSGWTPAASGSNTAAQPRRSPHVPVLSDPDARRLARRGREGAEGQTRRGAGPPRRRPPDDPPPLRPAPTRPRPSSPPGPPTPTAAPGTCAPWSRATTPRPSTPPSWPTSKAAPPRSSCRASILADSEPLGPRPGRRGAGAGPRRPRRRPRRPRRRQRPGRRGQGLAPRQADVPHGPV